jgi:hypothetical protein
MLTTKTIIEADVKASLISMTAIAGIYTPPDNIYIPYLMKNKELSPKALRHPSAIKVSISVDPDYL